MIENLPAWIDLLFIFTSIVAIVLFYFSNGKSAVLTSIIILWSVLQSVLAYKGFYQVTDTIPPRYILVLLPVFLFIIYGLLAGRRKWLIEKRNLYFSTILHTVRLPVEIVLFALYSEKMLPRLMTFEGRNFDIIMGLTAPVIVYFLWKNRLNSKVLLIWNIIGLFLILFVLINGILSAELPFQAFAFDQPNKAVNYFPYILLPATVVPIVIWSHLADIMKLKLKLKND